MSRPTKILVLGSGGREHAIADRCLQDEHSPSVYVMPGNPGMSWNSKIETINNDPKDFESLFRTIEDLNIDLVIVGPEALLELGVADFLRSKEVLVVGTGKEGALLESSKAFSKDFMAEFNIPTAAYKNFKTSEDAIRSIEANDFGANPVVKASALAGGKGVFVTENHNQAIQAVNDIFHNEDFKVFSNEIVVEENLQGKEVSSFALYDGNDYVVLGHASDYKRLQEGDLGPNTGGMGTWTPEGLPSHELQQEINRKVFDRVLDGLKKRNIDFKGILFAGLMVGESKEDLNVIEFNVRLGDPETQSVLPLLKGNFSESLLASAKGELQKEVHALDMDQSLKAVHVVKVSKFYPSLDGTPMLLDKKIEMDDELKKHLGKNLKLFFAGVKNNADGDLVNSGGRVLGLTGLAKTTSEARDLVYKNLELINFEGQYYRNDIAK